MTIFFYDTLSGTQNTTWSILNNGTLSLVWERPIWDTRNITRRIKINCSDSNHAIVEDRNISGGMIILAGFDLNATIICCHTLITFMNETGPQKCDKYPQRSEDEGKLTSCIQLSSRCHMMFNNYDICL